eukprot:TRINITY_DN56676_c0_g1_i1.p1 TRINITY_DN56676_c0_g1~~TRINITY_DN56676_c0_g1_i1.p1  ORF type:complete len:555 (-),score=55.69 TRINITY_DN56676_c0_g1_i1:98-1708(-)
MAVHVAARLPVRAVSVKPRDVTRIQVWLAIVYWQVRGSKFSTSNCNTEHGAVGDPQKPIVNMDGNVSAEEQANCGSCRSHYQSQCQRCQNCQWNGDTDGFKCRPRQLRQCYKCADIVEAEECAECSDCSWSKAENKCVKGGYCLTCRGHSQSDCEACSLSCDYDGDRWIKCFSKTSTTTRSNSSSVRQRTTRETSSSSSSFCFGRSSSWTISATNFAGPWRVTELAALRSGSYVLAANSPSGRIFVDRVWKNLHTRDNVKRDMIEIIFTDGSLVVTPNHVLYINGKPSAARDLMPGDYLDRAAVGPTDHDLSNWQQQEPLRVVTVRRSRDFLINPLTHSGRLLVASGPQPLSKNTDLSLEHALQRGMVLATTVVESPGDVLLNAAAMPRLGKLAAMLFPDAAEASSAAEELTLLAVSVGQVLPEPLVLPALIGMDAIATLSLVALHLLHASAIALVIAPHAVLSTSLLLLLGFGVLSFGLRRIGLSWKLTASHLSFPSRSTAATKHFVSGCARIGAIAFTNSIDASSVTRRHRCQA